MNNVIEFPHKGEHQWREFAGAFEEFLVGIGATHQEVPIILDRLRPWFEDPGWRFSLSPSFSHNFPQPLRQDQFDAISSAMEQQKTEIVRLITDHFKTVHTTTMFEFAKLELRLLRADPTGTAWFRAYTHLRTLHPQTKEAMTPEERIADLEKSLSDLQVKFDRFLQIFSHEGDHHQGTV